MYGLEAINANNGWAISAVGVTIVFSGLVMLSFVISQLHKVLSFWEDPSKIKAFFKTKKSKTTNKPGSKEDQRKKTQVQINFTESQIDVTRQISLLVRTMEDNFSLSRLLHLTKISDIQDPYSNLNNLLKAKIIIPDGSGLFTWDKEMFDKVTS